MIPLLRIQFTGSSDIQSDRCFAPFGAVNSFTIFIMGMKLKAKMPIFELDFDSFDR